LESALANVSRYRPERTLAMTGVGYLRPATPEEREQEMARSKAFIQRVKARAAAAQRRARKQKTWTGPVDCQGNRSEQTRPG
jgi:hypothetical protein